MALVLPQLWMALAAPSSPGPGNLLAPAATDDGWDGEVIRPAEAGASPADSISA